MSTALVVPTFLPNKGIKTDAPEELLADQISPYSRNMEYLNELIQARTGLTKLSSTALTGRVMLQYRFVLANQNAYNFFFTTTDIYTYDFTNSRFDIWTPVYTTGTIYVDASDRTIIYGVGTSWLANTKAGDYLKIGSGSVHTGSTWYQIASVDSDTQLTLTTAVPEGSLPSSKLQSHFDGVNGATAYTDPIAGAYTFAGTAQLSTAQKVFGTASLLLDGNSDYATLPDSANWNFGTGDLTIDGRIRTTDLTAVNGITGQWVDANNFWYVAILANGAIGLYTTLAGVEKNAFVAAGTITTGSWFHFAIVRSSGVIKIYIDGTYVTTTDNIAGTDLIDLVSVLQVGGSKDSAQRYFFGNIDELRISKGIARWTANFTPSTEAYTDPSAYVIRKTYTGGNTDFWTCTKFTDSSLGDIVVATNGVNVPVYVTGTAAAVQLTNLVSTMKAKYVTTYFDRLVFAWTVEGGSNQPERYRWSAVANANSYTATDFEDLIDDGTGITGMIKHGAYLIITKEKVFYAVRPVGGTDVYDSERASAPQGCKSNRSLVVDKQWLYYYCLDKKFHRWNLVTDEIISEGQFEDTKNFDPNLELYITGDNFYHKNQIRWFCPLSSSTYQNVVFVFDYKNESMNIWTTGAEQALLSIGHYLLQDDIYLDDAVWGEYYLDERTEYLDDVNFISNAPVFIYGGYDGYVRICDNSANDDGTAYTRTLRIKRLNFNAPQIKKRLWKQQYWFEQQNGGSVSISIYVDDKVAANAVGTLDLEDSTKDVVKLTQTVDLIGEVFQVEISATSFFALIGFLNYIFPKRRSF